MMLERQASEERAAAARRLALEERDNLVDSLGGRFETALRAALSEERRCVTRARMLARMVASVAFTALAVVAQGLL